MTDPYDPTAEWTDEVNAPDDPADDSTVAAKARFSALMDVKSSMGAFGSTMEKIDQKAGDKLRRSNEAKRKADRDPKQALEAADPHGLLSEEDRRLLVRNRGFDPDDVL